MKLQCISYSTLKTHTRIFKSVTLILELLAINCCSRYELTQNNDLILFIVLLYYFELALRDNVISQLYVGTLAFGGQ